MDFAVTPLEQAILDDIRAKTGVSCFRLGGIDTREESIAQVTLPVLRDWIPLVNEAKYRAAIYHRFFTPHAYSYLDDLITWWSQEDYSIGLSILTQTLAMLARSTDGERLWKLCQQLPPRPEHYYLLAKMATFSSVKREVRDELVAALERSCLPVSDLTAIARVDDPRIRLWFEGKTEDSNKYLRQLAQRVVQRGQRMPSGVGQAGTVPDRTQQMWSTEVDLDQVGPVLAGIAKELGLTLPVKLRQAKFLESAELDQWLVSNVRTKKGTPLLLWFRLEDVDTVELLLTPAQTSGLDAIAGKPGQFPPEQMM